MAKLSVEAKKIKKITINTVTRLKNSAFWCIIEILLTNGSFPLLNERRLYQNFHSNCCALVWEKLILLWVKILFCANKRNEEESNKKKKRQNSA